MFPITITINTHEQLAAVLAALGLQQPSAKPAKTEKPAQTPVKEEPQVEAPKPEPASSAPEAVASSTPADAPSRTVDDAKALTMKLVASKGRDAAVALLSKYGVPVAAKLPADKIADFCAEAEDLLK